MSNPHAGLPSQQLAPTTQSLPATEPYASLPEPTHGGLPGQAYTGGELARPQEQPQGALVLTLGVVSLFTCFVVGIVAVVVGNSALKEIDADPDRYSNRRQVATGRMLGILSIVLWTLGGVVYLALALMFAGADLFGSR